VSEVSNFYFLLVARFDKDFFIFGKVNKHLKYFLISNPIVFGLSTYKNTSWNYWFGVMDLAYIIFFLKIISP